MKNTSFELSVSKCTSEIESFLEKNKINVDYKSRIDGIKNLDAAVCNVLVIGYSNTGKTTLINQICSIEESACVREIDIIEDNLETYKFAIRQSKLIIFDIMSKNPFTKDIWDLISYANEKSIDYIIALQQADLLKEFDLISLIDYTKNYINEQKLKPIELFSFSLKNQENIQKYEKEIENLRKYVAVALSSEINIIEAEKKEINLLLRDIEGNLQNNRYEIEKANNNKFMPLFKCRKDCKTVISSYSGEYNTMIERNLREVKDTCQVKPLFKKYKDSVGLLTEFNRIEKTGVGELSKFIEEFDKQIVSKYARSVDKVMKSLEGSKISPFEAMNLMDNFTEKARNKLSENVVKMNFLDETKGITIKGYKRYSNKYKLKRFLIGIALPIAITAGVCCYGEYRFSSFLKEVSVIQAENQESDEQTEAANKSSLSNYKIIYNLYSDNDIIKGAIDDLASEFIQQNITVASVISFAGKLPQTCLMILLFLIVLWTFYYILINYFLKIQLMNQLQSYFDSKMDKLEASSEKIMIEFKKFLEGRVKIVDQLLIDEFYQGENEGGVEEENKEKIREFYELKNKFYM